MAKYPLTMEEAAAEFRMSRRSFQELIKNHPHYVLLGGKKLFYVQDIQALKRVGRREAFIQAHQTGPSGEPLGQAELDTRKKLAERLWPIMERKKDPPEPQPKKKQKRFYTTEERVQAATNVLSFDPRNRKRD